MGNESSNMEQSLVRLQMASETMKRKSQQAKKQQRLEDKQAAAAMAAEEHEIAVIHAENAIRCKNLTVTYLRLSARLGAIANKVDTAIEMHQVTNTMCSIVGGLEEALQTMNIQRVSAIMDRFNEQFAELDEQARVMDTAMQSTTSSTAPSSEIEAYMQQLAEANGIQVAQSLSAIPAPPGGVRTPHEPPKDELLIRFEKLKSGN